MKAIRELRAENTRLRALLKRVREQVEAIPERFLLADVLERLAQEQRNLGNLRHQIDQEDRAMKVKRQ